MGMRLGRKWPHLYAGRRVELWSGIHSRNNKIPINAFQGLLINWPLAGSLATKYTFNVSLMLT